MQARKPPRRPGRQGGEVRTINHQPPQKPGQDVEDQGQAKEIELSVSISKEQLSQAVLAAIRGNAQEDSA